MKPDTADLKHAVIYLRVSTAKQAEKDQNPEGYSIPAQREACRRTAGTLDAVVVEEFIDKGESARSADRPELQRMLARLEDGDISYCIVHKLDRLARSLADDVSINLAMKRAGVQLVSASEHIDETPSGKLLHGIMASISEFYSQNLSAEATKGMHQKVKMGGTAAAAPIGYLNVREQIEGREVRTVVVDPERAPLVRWAFEAFATGDYSIKSLTQALAERGLKTRSTPKRPTKALVPSRVDSILKDRYYLGYTHWRGIEYPGRHEPLVSLETFHKVQIVLKAHDKVGERRRVHDHYLKGMLYCGRCGARLCQSNSKGHGGRYMYFFCLGRQRKAGCRQGYIAAERIEDAIVRYYSIIQLEPARIASIRKLLHDEFDREQVAGKEEADRAAARLVQLEHERSKLLQAFYEGGLPIEALKREQDRINAETAHAQRTIAVTSLKLEAAKKPLRDALKLVGNCQKAYADAAPQIRRMFNKVFFTAIRITDGEVTGTDLAPAFSELLAEDLASRLDYDRREHELENPAGLSFRQGSSKAILVGGRGFEPLTPSVSKKITRSRTSSSEPSKRR